MQRLTAVKYLFISLQLNQTTSTFTLYHGLLLAFVNNVPTRCLYAVETMATFVRESKSFSFKRFATRADLWRDFVSEMTNSALFSRSNKRRIYYLNINSWWRSLEKMSLYVTSESLKRHQRKIAPLKQQINFINGEVHTDVAITRPIDLFTVVCLVTWPLNKGEAGGDLSFNPYFICYVNSY